MSTKTIDQMSDLERIVLAVFEQLDADSIPATRKWDLARAKIEPLRPAFDRARAAFRAVGGATTARDVERRRRGLAPRSAESDAFDNAHAALSAACDASNRALGVIRAREAAGNATRWAAHRAINGITDPQERLTALLSCDNAQVRLAAQFALAPAPPTQKRKRTR